MRLAHHENKEENVVLEDSASHRLNHRIMHSEPEDVILVVSTSYGRRCKKSITKKEARVQTPWKICFKLGK